jgi:hypothetical protein
MLKLLNKQGLPNVVSFELSDPEFNTMAQLHGFPVKNRTFKATSKILRNTKANKYLAKQFSRLEKAVRNEEYKKFDLLSKRLIRRSITYLIYSLNHVHPKWTSMDLGKIRRLLIKVQHLTNNLETDIYYKRIWIEKKPLDFSRPLGVPTSDWRIYLHMLTHIGEIFAKGKDLYSDHQHGGRPGKGVMSCLKEVAEYLTKFPKVYEFDLKGFFDHISHESMTVIFKGTFLEGLFKKLLESKPKEYWMPEEEDPAIIRYNNTFHDKRYSVRSARDMSITSLFFRTTIYTNRSEIIADAMADKARNNAKNPHPMITWEVSEARKASYAKAFEENKGNDRSEMIALAMKDKARNRAIENVEYTTATINLKESYKTLMNGGKIDISHPFSDLVMRDHKEATHMDRVLGRENWKDLDLPHQGVPQGTSFGPFLSSLAVGINFKSKGLRNWKMYIDDGLIFVNNDSELEKELTKANDALKLMSVEMEPSKSRLHSTKSLMTNSLKFLGIRFQKRGFFTISSDTRKGIKRELPELTIANTLQILENMYQDGMITVSRYKYTKWALAESKLRDIIGGDQLQLAIRYGYFGYVLSWLYNPEADMSELKRRIAEGTYKAYQKIIKQERSMGNIILSQKTWSYKDTTGMIVTCVPDLNNHSTLSIDLLLETIQHGYVSLRDYGLATKTKSSSKRSSKL